MDRIETFAKVCEEFLADPETFSYDAFADCLRDFADMAAETELKALAMCMVAKKD